MENPKGAVQLLFNINSENIIEPHSIQPKVDFAEFTERHPELSNLHFTSAEIREGKIFLEYTYD